MQAVNAGVATQHQKTALQQPVSVTAPALATPTRSVVDLGGSTSSVSPIRGHSVSFLARTPAVAGDSSRGYVPGSPGADWTEEEVRVVQEKVGLANNLNNDFFVSQVRVMIHPDKADSLYKWNPRFPDIVNEVYGMVWKPEDPSNKHWYNHSFTRAHPELAPTSRKLIQLAFHDCLKYSDGKGNSFGGCDGCLSWDGMDFLNEVPLGNMAYTFKVWPSYRNYPVKKKTDNNKLSTTVFALEWIYRVPNWPPGAPQLPQSLWSSGAQHLLLIHNI